MLPSPNHTFKQPVKILSTRQIRTDHKLPGMMQTLFIPNALALDEFYVWSDPAFCFPVEVTPSIFKLKMPEMPSFDIHFTCQDMQISRITSDMCILRDKGVPESVKRYIRELVTSLGSSGIPALLVNIIIAKTLVYSNRKRSFPSDADMIKLCTFAPWQLREEMAGLKWIYEIPIPLGFNTGQKYNPRITFARTSLTVESSEHVHPDSYLKVDFHTTEPFELEKDMVFENYQFNYEKIEEKLSEFKCSLRLPDTNVLGHWCIVHGECNIETIDLIHDTGIILSKPADYFRIGPGLYYIPVKGLGSNNALTTSNPSDAYNYRHSNPFVVFRGPYTGKAVIAVFTREFGHLYSDDGCVVQMVVQQNPHFEFRMSRGGLW